MKKDKETSTIYLKEFVLSIWCRQQALLNLLHEKGVVSREHFFEDMQKKLEAMLRQSENK